MRSVLPLPASGFSTNRRSPIQDRFARRLLGILLSALVLIVATSVRAEWVKVGEDDGSVVYVDPATLDKTGNMRRAWTLTAVDVIRTKLRTSYFSVEHAGLTQFCWLSG